MQRERVWCFVGACLVSFWMLGAAFFALYDGELRGGSVPVMLLSHLTAGIRWQATLQWPFIGFVVSLDVFLAFDALDPLFFAATLFFQVSI